MLAPVTSAEHLLKAGLLILIALLGTGLRIRPVPAAWANLCPERSTLRQHCRIFTRLCDWGKEQD